MHTFLLQSVCVYRASSFIFTKSHFYITNSVFIMQTALSFFFPPHFTDFFHVYIRVPELIRLTRVMVYPIGEDSLCRGLPICLRGRHASKTIYANGGGDAGHCGGADAWRSAATCSHGAHGQKQTERHMVSFSLYFFFPATLWRSFTLTGHLVTLGNVRGAGPVVR